MDINQEGYTRRLDRVKNILSQFGLKSTSVEPIAYVETCPFYFNNYIYKVNLETPALPAAFGTKQPCTTSIPPGGSSTLVVRLSNPLAEGLNNTNRVENEVAAAYLVRKSLEKPGLGPLVPAIYAWAPCKYPDIANENGFAWIISEFKQGADLNEHFWSLDLTDMKSVIGQIADLLGAVQDVRLPRSAPNFGALSIEDGKVVSGQMPLVPGGPFDTYAEVWIARLRSMLRDADKSPLLQGWKPSGIRERLEAFIQSGGVQETLQGVDVSQRALVHGDFTMNNMLYDIKTKKTTALLDFDWSVVSHPCDEYLTGLWDVFGGISERVPGHLQASVLSGNFGPEDKPTDDCDEALKQWEVARAWSEAAAKRGLVRPSTIAGVDRIRALRELEDLLCPFHLSNGAMLERVPAEAASQQREETETRISGWLDKWDTVSPATKDS